MRMLLKMKRKSIRNKVIRVKRKKVYERREIEGKKCNLKKWILM
jgi:hypothetical protein